MRRTIPTNSDLLPPAYRTARSASVALTTLTGDSAQARNELLGRTDEVLVRIAD